MPEPPRKRWNLKAEAFPPEWVSLSRQWGIPDAILSTLWNRGVRTPAEVERFLGPSLDDLQDPNLLTDCARAVDRLEAAVRARETVFVFGDYDVDGITAAALWVRLLRHFGLTPHARVPNRMEDGYGLSVRAIEEAKSLGSTLLVTNDCGTSAHEAIERANALGIDVIVVDHHMPESTLPAAYALVNPRRPDNHYPFADLAAVGVAFKLLDALVARIGDAEDRRVLLNHLDLVAVGSVADVVPLRGENRILVHYGMKVLRLRRRPAFQALIEQAGLADKRLESSHIAFSIAPRLNAAGRLGHPEIALALLLTDDPEEARRLAASLERDNDERRRLHEVVLQEAVDDVTGRGAFASGCALVLGSPNWHPGVLGIAASRLVDRFGVPVILVSLAGETARGSARTPPGCDLLALVTLAAEHLSAFGGHRQAVGLSLDPKRFPEFQSLLEARSREQLAAGLPEATLELEATLEPRSCDLELARWIERLGPFGEGNKEPLFLGRAFIRPGRVLQERHLRLHVLGNGRVIDCIGFGLAPLAPEIPAGGAEMKLAFTPTLNRWRGQEQVQLKLKEIDFV